MERSNKLFIRGFTLMELLVVIAIIGILSSIVLANLNGSRQKARDAARVGYVKSVQLALELYFDAHNGQFPAAGTWKTDLAPIYIAAIPALPSGTPASGDYTYSPSGNTYQLNVPLEGNDSYGGTCDSSYGYSNYCVTPN